MALKRLSADSVDQPSGGLGDAGSFDAPFPEPPNGAVELLFDSDHLVRSRQLVADRATDSGMSPTRVYDLVLAVNEVLTNSIRHGGGVGTLRIWQDADRLVCEVEDRGRLVDPLAGRRRPDPDQAAGRGLWMAYQLCDLVQVRSPAAGTVVRLHMQLQPSPGT
jgi:anti-sigma regulatory factor (Ser/Thr protein kinase)